MRKNRMNTGYKRFFLIGVVCTLCACAAQGPKELISKDVLNPQKQETVSDVPDFVSNALIDGDDASAPLTSEKRFNVMVHNMPARDFFLSLVADAGVNVVPHPEVSGAVTLNLKNVTAQQTMDIVRDIYGYEYLFKDNIYIIYPNKIRTEVFKINYIDVKRVGTAETNVSIGDINADQGQSQSQNGGGGEGTQTGGSSGQASHTGGQNDSTAGSRVQTINKTDFWRHLKANVRGMLSADDVNKKVMVNPQSGLLIVTASPIELSAIRKFLDEAELSVKRQVVLEAQILEVSLKSGFEAGINWKSIQGQLLHTKNVDKFSGIDIAAQSIGAAQSEVFSSILKIGDIHDLLGLLQTQGTVQVLSSPRVSTVNNQKAIIRVGTDEFFVSGIRSNTTASAATTTTSPEVELTSFFSGISLDVTPQISETGEVILHIHPIVSEVNDQTKEFTVGDSKFSLPLALRDIRESDSVVKAQSGQLIVLGGLMQKAHKVNNGQQPLLGSIPLINLFFKTKARSNEKTELVILLKPTVVKDDVWDKQINNFKAFSDELSEEPRAR